MRRHVALIVLVVIAVNALGYVLGGVHYGGDSARYNEGAHRLLHGLPLVGLQQSYPGYIALVAVTEWIGAGTRGLLLVQVLLSAVATVALYDAARRLVDWRAGALAAGLFALNPEVWRYNSSLLTESVYMSLVALTVWAVVVAHPRSGRWLALPLILAFLTASVRQNGWMLPALVLLFAALTRLRGAARVAAVVIVPVLLLGAVAISPAGKANQDLQSPAQKLANGQIYADSPRPAVHMPSDRPDSPGFSGEAQYALAHPVQSVYVFAWRAAAEVWHVRARFPEHRNVGNAIYLPLLYAAALFGVVRYWHMTAVRFALALIVAHLAFVAITWADYDGRFFFYFLPCLALLAGLAVPYRPTRLTDAEA